MTPRPRDPTGDSGLVSWCRKTSDRIDELKIIAVEGGEIDRKTNGYVLRIPKQPKPKAEPGAMVKIFRIRDIKPDYLICNAVTFAGAVGVASGSDVNVAKNWKVRSTPFNGKSIVSPSGGSISYVYDLINTPTGTRRTATYLGIAEVQIVIPEYVKSLVFGVQSYLGDLIAAIEDPDGGTGVVDVNGLDVTWLDLNMDGRAWAEGI